MKEEFTKGELFIIEWQYDMLGGFKTALASAISRADMGNLARLSLGFPDEVEAFMSFSVVDGWWEKLQDRVIKESWRGIGR